MFFAVQRLKDIKSDVTNEFETMRTIRFVAEPSIMTVDDTESEMIYEAISSDEEPDDRHARSGPIRRDENGNTYVDFIRLPH